MASPNNSHPHDSQQPPFGPPPNHLTLPPIASDQQPFQESPRLPPPTEFLSLNSYSRVQPPYSIPTATLSPSFAPPYVPRTRPAHHDYIPTTRPRRVPATQPVSSAPPPAPASTWNKQPPPRAHRNEGPFLFPDPRRNSIGPHAVNSVSHQHEVLETVPASNHGCFGQWKISNGIFEYQFAERASGWLIPERHEAGWWSIEHNTAKFQMTRDLALISDGGSQPELGPLEALSPYLNPLDNATLRYLVKLLELSRIRTLLREVLPALVDGAENNQHSVQFDRIICILCSVIPDPLQCPTYVQNWSELNYLLDSILPIITTLIGSPLWQDQRHQNVFLTAVASMIDEMPGYECFRPLVPPHDERHLSADVPVAIDIPGLKMMGPAETVVQTVFPHMEKLKTELLMRNKLAWEKFGKKL